MALTSTAKERQFFGLKHVRQFQREYPHSVEMAVTVSVRVDEVHAHITAEWLSGFDRETLYLGYDPIGIVGSRGVHIFHSAREGQ